ncbi:hypothetical protein [Streptomyces sp. VNUA74]|uniref:hypothetical protein n=1 Tax=Streptomyces sp. VNUA74 TaxID=3062685 RepID=UPI00280ABD34|nr:hypothetical protein [Streptomyces sp. VNUA74]WML79183.1 hypothetical protein Q3101_04720 [Streptomyces sp. VNUA74]
MTLDVSEIYAQVLSHAKRLGLFQRVLTHEPKSAPVGGLTCAIWASSYKPVDAVSGLDSTSMRLELLGRIYAEGKAQPEDAIDPRVLDATSKLIDSFTGDIQLGGVSPLGIDLLGAYGDSLSARWGFIWIDDKQYRVADLVIPLIIPDIYEHND